MQYNDETGQFEGKAVDVPDTVEVVEFTLSNLPVEPFVAPVALEDQMANVVGYGVCFWDDGNTKEEYPDESPSYRNRRSQRRSVKRAIKKAEREDAVLADRVIMWYE